MGFVGDVHCVFEVHSTHVSLSQTGFAVPRHLVWFDEVHGTHAPVVASHAGLVGSLARHEASLSHGVHAPPTQRGFGFGQSALVPHCTQTLLRQNGVAPPQSGVSEMH
jgi:hypothetical protein